MQIGENFIPLSFVGNQEPWNFQNGTLNMNCSKVDLENMCPTEQKLSNLTGTSKDNHSMFRSKNAGT